MTEWKPRESYENFLLYYGTAVILNRGEYFKDRLDAALTSLMEDNAAREFLIQLVLYQLSTTAEKSYEGWIKLGVADMTLRFHIPKRLQRLVLNPLVGAGLIEKSMVGPTNKNKTQYVSPVRYLRINFDMVMKAYNDYQKENGKVDGGERRTETQDKSHGGN